MTPRQLDVTVNGQLVGHLRENNDLWELEYSQEWVASARGFDLSPELPRAQAVHTDGASKRPVQWYFDNLLPEEALRTVIAKEADLSAEDAFGLLAHFGAESAGSLVLHDPQRPAPAERGLKPLPLAELSQRIGNLPKVSLTRDAPKKMSLAGAQHKMLVVLNGNEGNELFEPLPGTPSTHILKPNHQGDDYPASVMNEYFTMRLAKAVGLEVPEVRRMYVPQPVYLVERFDRVKGKDQNKENVEEVMEVQRRHVIDTCQLLGKARTFKYSAAHLDTLAQAVGLCRSRAAARLQLYRWVVFNVLIGNGDNHLKNISFLVDASGINVAPAYDLLCTAAYETRALADEKARWPDTALAFSLGNAKTFAAVTRAHVLEAGQALGLAATTAKRELDLFIKAVPLEADKLIADIEAHNEKDVAASPDPATTRAYLGGEMRMLGAVRHIVLTEMAQQLA
ncbi:MAG: HipA domain-containing protein [Polaromonas sp.]